ncbi:Ig-like domain-containing protein [Cesiribacter andamanensis]|uniref:Uncharacterized protein n=1 Tax=Cesiribacter andamanensis AMV16 TaxID=1279009 RepID=M7NKJ5_9BACT|nr:Ig-like domain-containing protein [Cesiribacter andamanensis]EMR02280.1 hypothetical protein ADICEAN_02589 [Cesiribacter andamanensis AMV16]
MNRLFHSPWSLLLVFGLLIASSCKKDDPNPAPSVEISNPNRPSGTTFNPGDPITFTITVSAPGGLKRLSFNKQAGSGEPEAVLEPVNGDGAGTFTHNFTYTAMVADGGKQVVLNIVAEDNAGQQGTAQYAYTVTEYPIVEYKNIQLVSAQHDSTSKTWFSTLRGERFSSKEIKEQIAAGNDISSGIDISYFYGDNMNATISSPSFYPKADSGFKGWGNINATHLRNSSMTPAQFAQISSFADLEAAFQAGITNRDHQDANATYHQDRIMRLTKDKVVVFRTDPNYNGGSRYGALLVTEIKGTRGAQDYLQFDMKVMPIPAE